MAVHWGGVAGMVFFYLVILAVGIWASRKTRGASNTERVMVGNRDFGWGVGLFTLIATWVGGGYINGTAEVVFTPGWGLVWAQAPWGYSLSFIISGRFFAKQMRAANYVTMLDPFQEKFGNRMGGIIFLSAITGELLWCAAILAALDLLVHENPSPQLAPSCQTGAVHCAIFSAITGLGNSGAGSTISVILELDQNLSVILSACIAASYTLFGGLFSVAYTDVVQLACIFVGLWFCVPFALTHEAVTPLPQTLDRWVGEWDNRLMGVWIDNCFLMIFGGVPWQAYYQRVLSARTPDLARNLSYAAAFGCLFLSIPAYLMGAVGASTDWSQTRINLNKTDPYETPGIVLPAVIQYLTPPAVAFLGLGAVSAAVMSSTDSSVLAASSMFVRNIYKNIFRPSASEREMMWVLRVAVIVVATIATVMALTVESIYVLFVLCADFVYVLLFPQFVCVIHIKKSNTYGSAVAFALGLLLRLLGGEPALNLPAAIHYPFYDEELGQLFPHRTFASIVSFITLVAVSYATDIFFTRGYIPRRFDIFRCVVNKDQMAYVRPGQEVNSHEANGHEMPSMAISTPSMAKVLDKI